MQRKNANVSLISYDDIFQTDESRAEAEKEKVQEIPVGHLHPYKDHPFKVIQDEAMDQMIESIKEYGVLTPLIARPAGEDDYEIVSGHRRHFAATRAGVELLPVIIKEMDDDTAVLCMVDSNIQRENILPSERAFAYKMKLEAMKRTAGRPPKENVFQVGTNKNNVFQVGTNKNNASQAETEKENVSQIGTEKNVSQFGTDKRSDLIMAEELGESRSQIQRYIRLTNLIPEILDKVDNKQISLNPAVELSYLKPEEQKLFLEACDYSQAVPSLSQAQRIKKLSQEGSFTFNAVCDIMCEVKKGDLERVSFKNEQICRYFPQSYTTKQMQDTIISLLDQWQKKRQREQER